MGGLTHKHYTFYDRHLGRRHFTIVISFEDIILGTLFGATSFMWPFYDQPRTRRKKF